VNAKIISEDRLGALVADLVASGTRVTAPARATDGKVDYRPITRIEEAVLESELPRRSLKEFFLPPTEPLFSWNQDASGVRIDQVPTSFSPHVVLGARPCDAAAVDILDRVMGWDYRDELWFGRREATTIASVACRGVDGSCFCSATGRGPESTRGSDLFMTPIDGGFRVEILTPKGEAFVTEHAGRFGDDLGTAAAGASQADAEGPRISLPTVQAWLERNFDHPLWEEIALRCHGCGACASVCPTCHCFDIVDEAEGVTSGTRRRNWDTCQASRFTVHASGHNPRPDQGARFRQRLTHKFHIYPTRFGEVLCTGCGRCSKACPGGMDLPEVLQAITRLAEGPGQASGGEA
jgi:ferredoxin